MNWTGSDNVSKWSLLKNRKRLFQSTCHSSNSSSSSSANDGLGDDENNKVRRIDHLEVRNRRSETVNPPMTESELDELEEYQAQCEYDDRVKRLKRWKFEIWKAAHLKNWKLTLKPGEFSFESDTE